MPKTRRNRKVGGKRRKSIKGGWSIPTTADLSAQASSMSQEMQAKAQKTAAEMQAEREKYAKEAAAHLDTLKQEAALKADAARQGLDSASTKLLERSQSGLKAAQSSFSSMKKSVGGRRKRYQKGGNTTPEKAMELAHDLPAVKNVKSELEMNESMIERLVPVVKEGEGNVEQQNANILKLEEAIANNVKINEKLANLIQHETTMGTSLRHISDPAVAAEHLGTTVQADIKGRVDDIQEQIGEEVSTRAEAAVKAGEEAQKTSKSLLSRAAAFIGLGGEDEETAPVGGRRRKRKGNKTRKKKGRKSKRRPKKGQKSKTRKGRLDFVTHKGDKYYNRKGHRQTRNRKGKKGRPYASRKRR